VHKPEISSVIDRLNHAARAHEDALRERDRAILSLARKDGLSPSEIAPLVKLTSARVGVILKQGR
jgi:DNA-directed RNA polymerase specialized sigma subunit